MDVIASTAFGIQIDSHNDPQNEFVLNANKLFKFKLNGPMLLFSKLFVSNWEMLLLWLWIRCC